MGNWWLRKVYPQVSGLQGYPQKRFPLFRCPHRTGEGEGSSGEKPRMQEKGERKMATLNDWFLAQGVAAQQRAWQTQTPTTQEEGSTTVEYAVGAVATAAFAGLLLAVLKSGGVKSMINNIIQTALSL